MGTENTVENTPRFGSETAVGHVREHNEDSHLADQELGLFIVADGMGGHEAGEVASRIACASIRAAVAEGQQLSQAIAAAQAAIARAIDSGEGASGMGTTVVALRIDGMRYRIAWVGDSRAYLWHDGQLRQLTQDHSYVQELIDNNAISREEAETHPEKSTLSRCLGGGLDDELEIDELSGHFFSGERLVLCTDGVSGELSDDELAACLRAHTEEAPEKIAAEVVASALAAGGNDNATVIVIEAPAEAPDRIRHTAPRKSIGADPQPQPQPRPSRRWARWLLIAVVLTALAWLGWVLWQRDTAVDHRSERAPPAQSDFSTFSNRG